MVFILALATTSPAAPQKPLWQSSDQFVALEPQDSLPTAPAAANDHPATLTSDRIAAILASLEIRAADNDKPAALFTRSSVQTIAPHLAQGLLQASPAEDVTFAVIGLHDTLYGLAKTPKVTTGRVFYKNGRLNIIIGLAQQEVRERDDRRLFPFTPGKRQKTLSGEWQLLPPPARKGSTLERKDWVTFAADWQEPATELNAPPGQPAAVQPGMRTNDHRTAAERLTTLKELRDKGLISEAEYQGKRAQILDGL
jgi:hypothetical protein